MSDTEKQPKACVHGGPVRHFNCDCSNCKPVPVSELEKLRAEKNGAYAERNQLVALAVRMALALGWKAGVREHPTEDTLWEADWRTVVFVELPTGQASWHFHDSEKHLLGGMPRYVGHWDGHSTPEKYKRVNAALFPPALTPEAKPAPSTRGIAPEEWCLQCRAPKLQLGTDGAVCDGPCHCEAKPAEEVLEQAKRSAAGWQETAERHCRNEEYYRGLVRTIGEGFGAAAKTSDDGSIHDSVLCARVPELVAALQARLEMNRHQGDFLQARLEEVTRGRDEAVRREVGNFEEVKTHRAELMLLHARLARAEGLLRNCDLSLSDPEWDAERCAFLAESAPAAEVKCEHLGSRFDAALDSFVCKGCGRKEPAAQPKAEPPTPGLYRHHKGGLYRVTGTARDSTNGPGEGRTLVLYREEPFSTLSIPHAREVGQFLETVDGKPRFAREGT